MAKQHDKQFKLDAVQYYEVKCYTNVVTVVANKI